MLIRVRFLLLCWVLGFQTYKVDGENVVPAVHAVLKQIREFSDAVRSGAWKGCTGKKLTSVVAIGIGGSYLGANFVYESLHTDADSAAAAKGRQLRFLANVDPVGSARALEGLDPETTLAIVISKTFTTRETILNARTVRSWLQKNLGDAPEVVGKHMVAVSTNLKGQR
jgi:glucose-6-phosphate isomerase